MVVVRVEVVVIFGILVVLFVTQLAVERLPHLHDGLCQFLLLLCLALEGMEREIDATGGCARSLIMQEIVQRPRNHFNPLSQHIFA